MNWATRLTDLLLRYGANVLKKTMMVAMLCIGHMQLHDQVVECY